MLATVTDLIDLGVLVTLTILLGVGACWLPVQKTHCFFVVALLMIGVDNSVCESLTSAVCVEIGGEGSRYISLTQCFK